MNTILKIDTPLHEISANQYDFFHSNGYLIIDSLCDFLHQQGLANQTIKGFDRLRVKRETSMAAQLCMKSGTRLSTMMGVTAQTGRNSVQRHFRDLRTMSTHGALHWDNATTPTGQYLLGIETGDALIDDENAFIKKDDSKQ